VRDVITPRNNEGGFTIVAIIVDDLSSHGPAGSEIGVKGWVGAFKLSPAEPLALHTITVRMASRCGPLPDHPHALMAAADVWGARSPMNTERVDPSCRCRNPTPDFNGDTGMGQSLSLHDGSCSTPYREIGLVTTRCRPTIARYDLTQAQPAFISPSTKAQKKRKKKM